MRFKRHIPKLVGTSVVLGVGVFMVFTIRDFLDAPVTAPKKSPQQITLLTPPPPPPPPKLEEKPPEPEVKEEVKLEEPEPVEDLPEETSDEPPPGADLGVDAEGGAGGDGFGLIGRKGGRGLLAGAGDPFVAYAMRVQKNIEDRLSGDADARRKAYSVVAKIWVSANGRIERAELADSTGNQDVDAALERSLAALPPLAEVPPQDMPQPIRLRISSRL
ncbi:MAG: energy transducer TonB [Gammaproteobacteria bacterium]|nr:energy transducer TonB [Gammaproteobacteria bacterium]